MSPFKASRLQSPTLFLVVLGGRTDQSLIELHDVRFVVGRCIDRIDVLVAQEGKELRYEEKLDGTVSQRNELQLTGRHRNAMLTAACVSDGTASEHDDKARAVTDRVTPQFASAKAVSFLPP